MRKIVKKKYINSFLIGVVLLSAQIGFANENGFQNNLLKMDVYKTSKSGVNVTLYTSHPYKEPLVVNKKGSGKYVIYLPGTANSLTSRPNKSSADIVQNIDVKTQGGDGKTGYTKVVISTSKDADIIPHVQTLKSSSYRMSDAEYKDLMSHVAKTHKKTVSKATAINRSSANRIVRETKNPVTTKRVASLPSAKKVQKQTLKVSPVSPKKTISAPKIVQRAINKLQAPKKNVQPFKKVVASKVKPQSVKVAQVPQNKSVEVKQPKKVLQSQPNKMVQTKPTANAVQTKPVTVTAEPKTLQKPVTSTASLPKAQKRSLISRIKHKAAGMNNFYLMALTLLPVLLILLIAKSLKGKKKMYQTPDFSNIGTDNQDENFKTSDFNKKEVSPEPAESWKDKYNSYVETKNAEDIKKQEETKVEQSKNIDTLFEETTSEMPVNENVEENLNENPIEENISPFEDETFKEEKEISSPEEEEDFSFDEILGSNENDAILGGEENPDEVLSDSDEEENDFEFENKELPAENIESEESLNKEDLVKSSYSINDESGFYLVDYENSTSLVGYIGEEIFVLKQFATKISGKIYARLSERKGSANSYMVKVAGFKALVEVSAEAMKVLIEL